MTMKEFWEIAKTITIGDIIGGICLFAIGIGLFVFVPLFFG